MHTIVVPIPYPSGAIYQKFGWTKTVPIKPVKQRIPQINSVVFKPLFSFFISQDDDKKAPSLKKL